MKQSNKRGVFIKYGKTQFKLSAKDLQLIADALAIINPDSTPQENKARKLSAAFAALSEYEESICKAFKSIERRDN
jgi:hypothetical protein